MPHVCAWAGTAVFHQQLRWTQVRVGAGTTFPITSSKSAFLHHSHRTHQGLDLGFSDPSNERPSRQPQNIGFLFSGFSNPRQLFSDFDVVLLLLPRFQPYPSLRQKLICSASRVTRGLGNKVKYLHGFWDYHTPPPNVPTTQNIRQSNSDLHTQQ